MEEKNIFGLAIFKVYLYHRGILRLLDLIIEYFNTVGITKVNTKRLNHVISRPLQRDYRPSRKFKTLNKQVAAQQTPITIRSRIKSQIQIRLQDTDLQFNFDDFPLVLNTRCKYVCR